MSPKRISPAMVVAVVAVVLACTGSAVGASLISSSQIKNGTISKKDLSKSVRKALAKRGRTGPQGPAGAKGAAGPAGPAGAAGATGAPGKDGQALAYGRVDVAGALVAGSAKALTVTKIAGTGIVCLDYTAGTPHVAVATIDVSGADSRKALVSLTTDPPSVANTCPAPADIAVFTADAATSAAAAWAFSLAVLN